MNKNPAPSGRRFGRLFGVTVVALLCCIAVAASFRFGRNADASAIALTDENFAAAIASGVHVVDFWAEWCGPCRLQAPILDQAATHYAGRIGAGKVDVDEQPALARQYQVESIPTVIIFKDGTEAERFVGVAGFDDLQRAIGGLL